MRNVFARHFLLALACLGFQTATAATLTEDFSTDPSDRGWRALGPTNLFQWNAPRSALDVTWDSSRGNTGFTRNRWL